MCKLYYRGSKTLLKVKVNHSLLIHKLRYYGIDGKTTRWIQNWLEDRQQTVVLDGVSSEAVSVDSGVPQGSVLVPGMLRFFVSFRIFFFRTTRVRIFIFFVAQNANFFFQNSTLGYMTKTLNQIIFFSSTKIRIFFSATLGIRIFFLEKTHNPPSPFKLNGHSLSCSGVSI